MSRFQYLKIIGLRNIWSWRKKLVLSRSAEPLLTIDRNKVKQTIDMNDDKSPIEPDSTPLRNIVDREARGKPHTVWRKQI